MKLKSLSFLVLASCALGVNAQVYTWKDANGRTHFSDRPPIEAQAKTTRGGASRPTPEDSSASEPKANASGPRTWEDQDREFRERRAKEAEDQAKAQKDAAAKAEKARYCDSLKRNLALVERGGRVAQPSASGEAQIMSDAQLSAEASRLRSQIAKDCN